MTKKRAREVQIQENEEAHRAIARLASSDTGSALERIVERAAAKRQRLASYLAAEFELNQAAVEAALLAFEDKEDADFLAR